jgi:8-oxo-dGTP diphosphatase
VKSIICAAAVIRRGDKVLIAQREHDSNLEPLKWEFPGGKIEFTEDPRVCLVREIKEEMDFDIEINDIFEVVSHNYQKGGDTYHVLLLCYLCTYLRGQPRPIECHDLRWVGSGEIGRFDFAAADIPIVAKVCNCLFHAR